MGLGAADGSEFGYVLGSELGIAEGLFVSEMDGKVEIIKLGSVDCAVDGFSLFEAEGMVLGGCVMCLPPPHTQQAEYEFFPFDQILLTTLQKVLDSCAHPKLSD